MILWKGVLAASRAVLGDECKALLAASLVDDFISIGSGWNLVAAVKHGHMRLIARIGLSQPRDDNLMLLRHQDCNRDLIVALLLSDIDAAKMLVQVFDWVIITKAVVCAAAHGQVPFLRWLNASNSVVCWGGNEMRKAARAGHLETLKWLQENTVCLKPQRLLDLAARHHSPEILRWVMTSRGETPVLDDLICAAHRGCLSNLKILFNLMPCAPRINVMGAVAGGHLDVAIWLKQNGGIFTNDVIDVAAENGHLHMVQFLYAHKLGECSTRAMEMAAYNGHLHLVKWIVANQPSKLCRRGMVGAFAGGHLKIARWLRENSHAIWSGRLVDVAAQFLHRDGVAWVVQHFPNDATTAAMDEAARANREDVFLYLHYNGRAGCTASAMDHFAARGPNW